MILDQIQQDIETFVRAKYPLVYLVTHEEQRARDLLGSLAQKMEMPLYFWSCTRGLICNRLVKDPQMTKPEAILDYIQTTAEGGFFVLLDFHAYLDNPRIVRGLRDTMNVLSATSNKSIFVLSPKKTVPTECEKQFILVELPTPDVGEIRLILQRSLQAVKGRVKVELDEEGQQQLAEAFRGLPSMEIENVLSRMMVRDGRLNTQDLKDVIFEKGRIISASGLLQFFPSQESLDTVGGLDRLKTWLRRKQAGFSQRARDFGLDMPKGVLLVGVPGCGKSLTAKAVSSLWQMPLIRMDIGQLFSSFIGSSEENLRKAIQTAEAIAPCVFWVDEIEKGLAGAQGGDSSDGGLARRMFATLLTWMQEKKQPVFLVATANDVSRLPPEFLRKGRFDEIFYVDLPRLEERAEILGIHLAKRRRDPARFDLAALAARTEGFCGADLESVVMEGLDTAFWENRDLTQSDLDAAAAACVPLGATMAERITEIRQWAEGRARPAS
ncbi:MAG: AAA family ATPase [Verrucomicrobiae bacterium]|nr:AAA family ATPase [Verrucomicrobiae bacterium]